MKVRITLRTRLVLLVVAALVPLFGLSMLQAWLNADAAISRTTGDLKFAASLIAANQGRVADSAHQLLSSIAGAPGLTDGKAEDCQRYFKTLKEQLSAYANLGIIGLDGRIRCHAVSDHPLAFVGDRDYFQETLTRRRFTVGGYLMGRIGGKQIIMFTMPVRDRVGNVTALAFAAVDLNEIAKAVANAPLPRGGRLEIMDRQGILLAVNPAKPELIGRQVPSHLLQQEVKTMRTGVGEGFDGKGRQRIFAFLPIGDSLDAPFFVAVSANRDEVVGPVEKQLELELLALALVAFLGGWLAWMMGGRAIVAPTTKILNAIRQVQQGRLDVRIPVGAGNGKGEFYKIADGFNRMTESVQKHREALEAELARSEAVQEKLQDAQRLGRIGYWQVDFDTQRVWWSDEVYEVLGIDRTFFDGTSEALLRRIHPGDRDAFKVGRDIAARAGLPFETEFRVVTSTGEVRWIHYFGRVYGKGKREGEQATRRCGVIQEITERKRAELSIARSREMLGRTGAIAKIGGWEVDVETMRPYWSEELYHIHELDLAVDLGLEAAMRFYAPEAQPIIKAAMEAAVQDATPWDMELPLITAKGRRIWVRSQGRALLQDGKVVRLVGVLQDVTAQHESQAHLRLLEICLSRLNDMVLITKAEPSGEIGHRIVFVNDAFERRTGYSRQEVLGKSSPFLQGPTTDRSERDRVLLALKKWQPIRAELSHYTKSGEEFWVELDMLPIPDDKGGYTHWVSVQRDITERKRAEQELVDSDRRYNALFESAPVPMAVFDRVTRKFLTVNQAAVRSYGYSVEEFLSMTLSDVRLGAVQDGLRKSSVKAVPKRARYWQHRRKDGSIFPVDVVSQSIQYAGRAAHFVVALDMTANIKAEQDAQEHLFTLQRAADAAQAITWHQTLEGTMQEIAEQARGVIGAHQAVVTLTVGEDWTKAINMLSLSEKYAKYQNLIKPMDGTGIYELVSHNNCSMRMTQAELEVHPRWRDFGRYGDEHPAMRGWLAVPLIGRNGQNIGLLQLSDKYEGDFTQQDEYVAMELAQLAAIAIENARLLEQVSQLNAGLEQKVAERTVALARQEALFRALAEQAPQTIWTATPDGAATYFNRAWFDLMGGKLDDWAGTKWFAAIHPEDLPDGKANWRAASASQSLFVGIRRVLAKDGSCHTMSYRASPVLDEQGAVVFWVGVDADITEIKVIEAALRLSNRELEAFSYSVSHDLRSPLNTINGFSLLLAKQLGDADNEKVRHYLSRIQAGAAQMGQLIEDLLSLAQVSRAQLRSESVDLSVLARSILNEWQGQEPERKVVVNIESGLQLQGDGRLVRVAIENLLSNAWKFTSQKATAEINVGRTFDAAGLPVFFVSDNGAGFDMAYADKLFTPFQRLHATSEFPGTGIGLATVGRIIARHGGRLWADAAPGRGATLFFTLPRVPVAL
ncbi:MAG: PAS domain S-box protein [Polaromonas sp.]|uniref:PAS domain S-box protein n=1 Tax=Polaromonas sp. TaxID=1869339 RepID=UPI00180CBE4C|nr:PAS domain S-box protein [Polaromonas sp.]NMM11576.1 PAS domain S-box protein [Polaromonas sp.]